MELDELFKLTPYGLKNNEKSETLIQGLTSLTVHHEKRCRDYRNILSALGFESSAIKTLTDLPFLPVRLFKEFELKSVKEEEVIKVLKSSGTTSMKLSKIFLDRQTALYQTRALVNIMQDFIGKKRLPMLIADSRAVLTDRSSYSARAAGILGMANFGRDHLYLLDEAMELDFQGLDAFLNRHREEDILVFGFTYMIWQYIYKPLLDAGGRFDLGRAILIHSGGWKRLTEDAVDNEVFKKSLKETSNIKRVYNFYGMVEQVGSVFVECEDGYFHAPNFADVIIRDPRDWSDARFLKEGVVEVVSLLPHSYPGHVILTEDVGTVHGEDDCNCGRYGKYFSIKGRVPQAEMRGCGDTHAYGEGNGL
jgi:hypothetical protein